MPQGRLCLNLQAESKSLLRGNGQIGSCTTETITVPLKRETSPNSKVSIKKPNKVLISPPQCLLMHGGNTSCQII